MKRKKAHSCVSVVSLTVIVIIGLLSCATVKPYQRVYLNDEAMQLKRQASEKFATSVHNYREAASGGGKSSGSGGCGCN